MFPQKNWIDRVRDKILNLAIDQAQKNIYPLTPIHIPMTKKVKTLQDELDYFYTLLEAYRMKVINEAQFLKSIQGHIETVWNSSANAHALELAALREEVERLKEVSAETKEKAWKYDQLSK